MPFICQATWIAKPGREHLVRRALGDLAAATRTEPGNLCYQPYGEPGEPSTFRIFEVYVDADAFEAHGSSDHFREFAVETAIPELASRTRELYETLEL